MQTRVREIYDEKNNLTDMLILQFKNSETDYWYGEKFDKCNLEKELNKVGITFNKNENYREWREV